MVRHDPDRNLPLFWETPAAHRSTFLLLPLTAFLLAVELWTEFVQNVPLMALLAVPSFIVPVLRMPLKARANIATWVALAYALILSTLMSLD
jgi:hypothetical protein